MPVFTGQRRPANGSASALGMEVLPLDPLLRKDLHLPKEVNGVMVGKVASDSPAGELQHPRCRRSIEAGGGARQRAVLLNRHGTS